MSSTTANNRRSSVLMAAIDPYVETNIVSPKEKVISAKDRVEWGAKDIYPDYLLDLYNNVPTLRSVISGNVDFITGDDATIMPLNGMPNGQMNRRGDTIREVLKEMAFNYQVFGGYALQIIRNLAGDVAEIYVLDMRYVRANKECDVFYYSEKWTKNGKKDVIVYPAFIPNLDWAGLDDKARMNHASSILYVKNTRTQVYPAPLYAAAVKACEIERLIDDFHINSINNQFVSSAIINFNNGIPDQEQQEAIERDVNEKFAGSSNAARIMLSWNANKESATDIVEFKVEDFGERYKALSEHSRQQIFTSFRANPNLFGIPTEGNGFANEQYAESFKLYNRTQIQPVQKMIADTFDKVYGMQGVLTIVPFSMAGETENKVD